MNYTTLIPSHLKAEYQILLDASGMENEKFNLWKKLVNESNWKQGVDELYQVWINLFKNNPLPIAWKPSENEFLNSNLSLLLDSKQKKTYEELHQWSMQQRADFWKEILKLLEIKFHEDFNTVQKGDVEDPTWFDGASMNIVESCFMAPFNTTAIIQGQENQTLKKISYGELYELVNKIASGLTSLGLSPNDAIVLYMPLTIESIASYLAIVKAGMVVVSVADSFSAQELKKRIEITKAKAVITCDGYFYGGKNIDLFSKVKESNAPKAIVANYIEQRNLRPCDIQFEDLLKDDHFDYHYSKPDATTNILFSSGTTKEPKAIPWTHLTPLKCAADGFLHQDIHPNDVVCWTTGMGWMMAPWLIYATLINKATIAIFTGASTSDEFGKFMEESRITILGTIPSVVKAWRGKAFDKKFDWKNIRLFSSTGEPSNQEDYFYLMALTNFKAPIIEYCGGTEIGGGYITGSVLQPSSPATFTSPAMGMSFYLLNDKHQPVANGKAGEVFIVPPSIGLTQKLLNKNHHDEYYEGTPKGPNGELLRRHGDAFETIEVMNTCFYKSIGRTDDAMNLGGVKISAVEIEEVLNQHSQIKETVAISVPGENGGPEKLIVFADTDANDIDTLKRELQGLITKELNPLFKISELIKKKNLPRTASNKLMRRELRKELMDR